MCALVCALAVPVPAHAYKWPSGVLIKAASNGTPVIAGAVSRGASVATTGGAAALRATQILGLDGASAALTLSRGVALSNLALVARIAAGALGPLGIGALALTGVYWASTHWEVSSDPIAYPSGVYESYSWRSDNGGACALLATKCSWSAAVASLIAQVEAGPYTFDVEFVSEGTWSGGCVSSSSTCIRKISYRFHHTSTPSVWSVGFNTVTGYGSDGPGVGPGVPATDAQLENAITTALQAQPTLSGSVLDAALAHKQAELALVTLPQVATGPATVTGPSRVATTVDASGTTTTTVVTTYNLTYEGDVVTVNESELRTTTLPDGSTSTTTTTTAAPDGDPPPPDEEKSKLCEDFPDISACAEFGDEDDGPELEDEQRALSWVPSMSASGVCPAAETATVHGRSVSISWQPVCDLASGVRPVVLAIAWLSAGAFVFGVGRKVAA